MSGYEYEDETQGVTWSIVNDIKQVTEDIISALVNEIELVSIDKLSGTTVYLKGVNFSFFPI